MSPLTALDILHHLIDWGGRFSNRQGQQMLTYFDQMLCRSRCLTLSEQGILSGVCAFFLLDASTHVETWHTGEPWSTPEDTQGGTMIFIDFMAATRWIPTIRRAVEERLVERFPSFTHAVYFRGGSHVRKLVIPRRRLDGATV